MKRLSVGSSTQVEPEQAAVDVFLNLIEREPATIRAMTLESAIPPSICCAPLRSSSKPSTIDRAVDQNGGMATSVTRFAAGLDSLDYLVGAGEQGGRLLQPLT
jgi:hypothetical protein